MLVLAIMPMTVFAANTATVEINGQALTDGTSVQCGEGTAIWNQADGTLTLNNATITQTTTAYPVRVSNGDLTVVLIGENTITSTDKKAFYGGTVNLTIEGTEADSLIIETDSDGLQIDSGNLTIDGCNINITSSSYGGLMCFGSQNKGILTIQNGANIIIDSFENSLIGNNGLVITDSTVNATARSNPSGGQTCAISSNVGNISITRSIVTAIANGDAANAIYARGTISIDNAEVSATTTVEGNAYPAFCADSNIEIINHSSVTVNSAGTIGIWSSGGAVGIHDSIAYVAAHDDWDAIRGGIGGATISGSWIETFGAEISPAFTSSDSVIFFDNEGSASGSLTLPGDVTVGKEMRLSIPAGSSITVPNGVTLTNHGQIELHGDLIYNGGNIVCDSHVGGTATCISKAVCDICGSEYGAFNPDNHSGKIVWTQNETTHFGTYSCCHVLAVPEEAHQWENSVCIVCGMSEPSFGGNNEPSFGGNIEIIHPNGWEQNRNGEWVYYKNGRRVKGWIEENGISYYLDEDYTMVTGWKQIDDKWYYFYTWGGMAEGWAQDNDIWYYFDPETGVMQNGWIEYDNNWYYLKDWSGMVTGWQYIDNVWYYFKDWGGMATGWQYINGNWYYFRGSGAMVASAWVETNGKWYYLTGSGAMAADRWVEWKGEWYYLYSSGAMATNATIDGYYVNASGAWVQ